MLTFLICFSGYITSLRLFSSLFCRFNINRNARDRVSLLILVFDLIVMAFLRSLPAAWASQCFILGLILCAPFLFEKYIDRKIRDFTVPFLDQIILVIQAGRPLRMAIKEIVDRDLLSQGWRGHELSKAYSAFILSSGPAKLHSSHLQKLFEELHYIDNNRSRTLEQLRSLRWHYQIHENFRRRSGQVGQQSRIQAVVVSILYVGLLLFNTYHFGFSQNLSLTLVSLGLFVVGLIMIFVLGRRLRWKV